MSTTPIIASLLLARLATPALGATPVIHADENPSKALGKVMVETGLAPDSLRAVTVAELVEGHRAKLVGAGRVVPCSSTPTGMAAVNGSLEQARGAMAYMEHDKARAAIAKAQGALGCLGEPLAADVVARLHYYSGLVAYETGDKATAWSEYFRAHVFDPDLPWDEQLSPKSKPIFDLASSEARKSELVDLRLLPPFPQGTLLVDGHPVGGAGEQVDLHPGEHIVQVLGQAVTTYILTLDASTSPLLVVPEAMPDDAATWAARAELRPTFSKLLSMVEKEGQDVYVTALDGLWKTTVGSDAWEELVTPSRVSHLLITGLPAGGEFTFVPADGGTVGRVTVPWDEGELDEAIGLPILAEHRFEGLSNGPYTYRLDHPLLGSVEDLVVVNPGETTTLALDWAATPGAAQLGAAYQAHKDLLRSSVAAQRSRKVGRGGLLASALLGAGTVGLAARGLFAQADVSGADKQYQDALGRADATAAAEYYTQRAEAQKTARTAWIGAGSLGAATGVTVAFSFGQLKRAKKSRAEIPSWDPQSLSLAPPEPEAPAQPQPAPEPAPGPAPAAEEAE